MKHWGIGSAPCRELDVEITEAALGLAGALCRGEDPGTFVLCGAACAVLQCRSGSIGCIPRRRWHSQQRPARRTPPSIQRSPTSNEDMAHGQRITDEGAGAQDNTGCLGVRSTPISTSRWPPCSPSWRRSACWDGDPHRLRPAATAISSGGEHGLLGKSCACAGLDRRAAAAQRGQACSASRTVQAVAQPRRPVLVHRSGRARASLPTRIGAFRHGRELASDREARERQSASALPMPARFG